MSTDKSKRPKKTMVVPCLNVEGASAAALLLRQYPHAEVRPSSAHGIHRTLRAAIGKGFGEIHICGLGIKCEFSEVLAVLASLKQEGVRVVWYCGRDYLDSLRKDLEPCVECRFTGKQSGIAATVYSFLSGGTSKDAETKKILKIGTKPDHYEGEPVFEKDLKDLVDGSIWRFLNYRDFQAYPHAVRVLAGIEQRVEKDQATIETYRRCWNRVLVGKSETMERVRDAIGKCGPAESTVLITGETGTGKEIVARLLHESSPRAGAAFVAVNCATLDGDLQQAMLFGHEKGAFTGADQARQGCFEDADGGTLFLDEVAELAPNTQAKLLRVLQEGTFRRLGGKEDKRVDVRIVAATNRDLLLAVGTGKFRADLYYRLAILKIAIPPLRERKEDIPLLVRDILYRSREARGLDGPDLNERQLDVLKRHPWPGNIRELESALERFLVLENTDIETVLDKAGSLPQIAEEVVPLAEFEARYIQTVFEQMGRNISQTAHKLGVSRNTLKKKLGQA